MLASRSTPPSGSVPRRRPLSVETRRVLACIATSRILPEALVRPGRSEAIAAIVAHAGAGLPIAALALVADAGLVLFAIDDLLDDSDIAAAEAALRIEQYSTVARGEPCPEVAFDPIARAISDLRKRLTAAAAGADLVDAWAEVVARMLAAMGTELPGNAPANADLPRYLERGRDSIGVEMIAFTAWIATSAQATRDLLPALRHAERSFSMAVRVANDLRTCEREKLEGRVNAVTLLGEEGLGPLLRLRDRALSDGRAALARTGIERTPQARFLERFASAIVSMYETRDFQQAA